MRQRGTFRRLAAFAVVAATALAGACVGATEVTIERGTTTSTAREEAGAESTVPAVPVPGCVRQLSVEQKVSQLLMVLVSSPAEAGDLVTRQIVGGYSLVGTQATTVGEQIEAVNRAAALPLIVASDEEGGLVQRLRDVLGPIPAARLVASDSSPAEATAQAQDYARRMRELGFTMSLGPVLDVGTGGGLGERTYGDDPDTVSNYGLAVMQGIRAAGLVPVVKHWPGIGGTGADPHNASISVANLDALRARDLVPFQRAIAVDAPAVMVGHAIIPEVSEGLPATLSRNAITGVLRGEQGFGGLVITDSLGMSAVTKHHPEPTAALVSIMAGADIALVSHPAAAQAAHDALVGAANSDMLPATQLDQSVARVLAVKGITGACPTR